MFNLTLHESLLIIVSVLVTAGCFNIALYFGYHRRLTYLFFACYCLFHVFKIWLKTFPADELLIPALNLSAFDLIYLSVLAGMISLNTFVAYHFEVSYRKKLALLFVLAGLIFYFWLPEISFIRFGILLALAQTISGIRTNKSGYILLIGVAGFALTTELGNQGFLNYGYFMGVIFFVFSMMLAAGIELARRNKSYQKTLLRSTRLENRLLKKNIQPHFILNSLTSLQELIESDPDKASEFVLHLSREFELFATISNKKLISVMDELKLVESYLKVMSIRKSIDFQLKVSHVEETDEIPPGVLLTLVENGISHGFEDKTRGVFEIIKQEDDKLCKYSVSNDGNSQESDTGQGMGLSYILARLEESYASHFKFESKALPEGWISIISIFK